MTNDRKRFNRPRFMPSTLLGVLMALLLTLPAMQANAQGFGQPAESPVTPRITTSTQSIQPGQTITAALHFDIQDKWHLYWTNPEGPGFAPDITWTLPEGFTISDARWPKPKTFDSFGNIQFGYENSLTLLFDLTAPQDADTTTPAKLQASVTWLVCDKNNCVNSPDYPNGVPFSFELPVSKDAPQASADAELIKAAEAKVPITPKGWSITTEVVEGGFVLVMQAPSEAEAKALSGLYFFSGKQFAIDPAAEQALTIEGKTAKLSLTARKTGPYGDEIKHDKPITELVGVLTAKKGFGSDGPTSIAIGQGKAMSYADDAAADTPAQDNDAAAATNPPTESEKAGKGVLGFLPALGLAFVGGLILNLMPCVFPVLSIKILGFVQAAGEQPAVVRRHGYAFGIGVLLSFWVLVGILLGIRAVAGAGSVSWGYQLQEPIFVLGMLVLMFLIGLNLIGTFEFGVGLSAKVGQASQAVHKEGYSQSFFTGVLATLIATPCTAPLMAPAIGAALGMPTPQAFLVFTALGVGMALPYVLLSCFPVLLQFMPRPGAWMESFKQAMAFPMFATAGWLAWVYIGLTSEEFGLTLLIALSVLAMGVWIFGRWSTPMRTSQTRWIARVVALVAVLGSIGYIHNGTVTVRAAIAEADRARAAGEYVYEWVDYSPATVDQLRGSGRPVLVDFTARWCAVCQVNKKSSLRNDAAEALYKEYDVALVEADNTIANPAINEVLQEYNRAGVPLYLVFPADGGEPEVLPELLSPAIVRNAIERAAGEMNSDTATATASR